MATQIKKGTTKAVEAPLPDLAKLAIEAHGGLDRWKRFTTVSVHGINGGVLWGAKGKAGVLGDVTVTVDLRNEKVSHCPLAIGIEGLASSHSGSCSKTRTAKYLRNFFNPGHRSKDILSGPPGMICNSHTSLVARCGRI